MRKEFGALPDGRMVYVYTIRKAHGILPEMLRVERKPMW